MLISHERLAQLKEQLDYLEQAYQFAFDRNVLRLGKQGVSNDDISSEAILETDSEFERAGMNTAQARIQLEIDFLTDYFK